jgi:hypothetical protein
MTFGPFLYLSKWKKRIYSYKSLQTVRSRFNFNLITYYTQSANEKRHKVTQGLNTHKHVDKIIISTVASSSEKKSVYNLHFVLYNAAAYQFIFI